ncbi:MAG: hypothetical protein HGA85_07125 [Nanoarchaeota archaeon]|nr:hypothetical protein [Nanoarchaeota archaeon]
MPNAEPKRDVIDELRGMDKRSLAQLRKRIGYSCSADFVNTYGLDFCEFVASSADSNKATNLGIMCMGAEPLGTMLKRYFWHKGMDSIRFVPLYLNRDHMIGFNPLVLSDCVMREDVLSDYIMSLRLFDASKLLIIDTGHRGRMADLMVQVDRILKGGFKINEYDMEQGYSEITETVGDGCELEGLMLHHLLEKDGPIRNLARVRGLNETPKYSGKEKGNRLARMATRIDDPDTYNFLESPVARFGKSMRSPIGLENKRGVYAPIQPSYPVYTQEDRQIYLASSLGLVESIDSLLSVGR